jgi:hypothetical protein
MRRVKLAVEDETLEYRVEGRTVKVVTRPADSGRPARLFELGVSPAWNDRSPLSDADVAAVVSGLIRKAGARGEEAVIGVSPAAALSFPDDPRIYVSPVESMSFSLPGSPTGLVLHMDGRGDGHLWALGDDRISLGSNGMWWIVNALAGALAVPAMAARCPRFLTLGTTMGGPATQASLELRPGGIAILWRKLRSGLAADVVAVHELADDRVEGWLQMLAPVRADLERRRVHHERLRPARTAEKWARVLERWSN